MAYYFLSLGSNRGDRRAQLHRAAEALERAGFELVRWASLYETVPWGYRQQALFLNTMLMVRAADGLQPPEALCLTQQVERAVGRRPSPRWGPREIDIDLVWWGAADPWREASWRSTSARSAEPTLVIPHERAVERAFVLVPLVEIEPLLPLHGRPAHEWLSQLEAGRRDATGRAPADEGQKVCRRTGTEWWQSPASPPAPGSSGKNPGVAADSCFFRV